jgi:hypothetical protein
MQICNLQSYYLQPPSSLLDNPSLNPTACSNQPYQIVQASSCLGFKIWICKFATCSPIAYINEVPY